jgi:hypothetical protein
MSRYTNEDIVIKSYAMLHEENPSIDAKIAKRLLTRTHLISVVPAIWKSIESRLSDKQVAEWVTAFLSGGKSASVSTI